jgi:hypothetical protein
MSALTGDLNEFSVASFLGLLRDLSKTGSVSVSGDRGEVALDLIDGELLGDDSEAALFDLLRFETGTLAFEPGEVDATGSRVPVDQGLSAANARLDEWRSIEAVVPSQEVMVTLARELPAPTVQVDAEAWSLLRSVGTGETVKSIGEDIGLGEFDVSRLVKRGAEAGLVEVDGRNLATTAAPAGDAGGGHDDQSPDGPVDDPEVTNTGDAEGVEDLDIEVDATNADDAVALGATETALADSEDAVAQEPSMRLVESSDDDEFVLELAEDTGDLDAPEGDDDLALGVDLVADESTMPLDDDLGDLPAPPPPLDDDLGLDEDLLEVGLGDGDPNQTVDFGADLDDLDLPEGGSARDRLDALANELGADDLPGGAEDLDLDFDELDVDADGDLGSGLLHVEDEDGAKRWRPFRSKS